MHAQSIRNQPLLAPSKNILSCVNLAWNRLGQRRRPGMGGGMASCLGDDAYTGRCKETQALSYLVCSSLLYQMERLRFQYQVVRLACWGSGHVWDGQTSICRRKRTIQASDFALKTMDIWENGLKIKGRRRSGILSTYICSPLVLYLIFVFLWSCTRLWRTVVKDETNRTPHHLNLRLDSEISWWIITLRTLLLIDISLGQQLSIIFTLPNRVWIWSLYTGHHWLEQ